jgi:hypothetical protein
LEPLDAVYSSAGTKLAPNLGDCFHKFSPPEEALKHLLMSPKKLLHIQRHGNPLDRKDAP